MPAQSQQQQKLFGLALAFKRGEVPASEVSDEIKDIADRMSEKDIEDFAATKHKGLPKMKEQLRKIVREIMREKAISELNEDGKMQGGEDDPCWKGYEMVGMKMKDGNEVPNCVPKNESVVNEANGTILSNKILDFLESKKAISGTNAQKVHKELTKYIEKLFDKNTSHESVNEVASRTAMEIGALTGLNKNAVQDFVDKHDLDIEKLYKGVKSMNLAGRMNLVTAIAGKPGNSLQKLTIKLNKKNESVNEGFSTEEKRIVLMAVKKIQKYMNVDLPTAMNYVLGAGKELEREIEKGKIK